MRSSVGLMVSILLLTACAGDGPSENDANGAPYEVTEQVVSHPTTQDMSVWGPTAEGSWPVVFMLHGLDGSREELVTTAIRLAEHGLVAFVPDYRSRRPIPDIVQDQECAYRYALRIAEDFGGDLDQPVTSIGFSAGAIGVLYAGLDERRFGSDGRFDGCFDGVSRPDVVVSIAGCHYEGPEGQLTPFPMIIGDWANSDVELVLVAGEDDETCPAWQSEKATEALQRADYEARYVEIEDGRHPTLVYNNRADGGWVAAPDEPAGDATVAVILDAIADATG